MEASVRDQLLEMSRRFYVTHAASFDQSRRNGWQGWNRVLPEVLAGFEATSISSVGNVLDVGCGNGRFLSFLHECGFEGSYLGVDSSAALIEKARLGHVDSRNSARFEVGDVLNHDFDERRFDLAVCFGVLHHVPGFDTRAALLERLASSIIPGGALVVSFWQPRLLRGFDKKLCDRVDGLEDNDFLISWNGDCETPRYCHHFDDAEIAQLVSGSSLSLVNAFQGDGNDATNRYVLLTRQAKQ